MDVTIHTAMIRTPILQNLYHIIAASVFGCVLLLWVVCYIFDLTGIGITSQLIVGSLFVIISFWAVWVVKVFYDMVSWWTDIYQRVEVASKLLEQTRADIKEIKLINRS